MPNADPGRAPSGLCCHLGLDGVARTRRWPRHHCAQPGMWLGASLGAVPGTHVSRARDTKPCRSAAGLTPGSGLRCTQCSSSRSWWVPLPGLGDRDLPCSKHLRGTSPQSLRGCSAPQTLAQLLLGRSPATE